MKTRTLLSAAALGLMLGVAGGCGSAAPAASSDPGRARTVLRDALESWKRGDKIDAAARLSPPVIVADEDWLAGAKLLDYRIESGDQMVGTGLRCPVTLTLPDKAGKPKPRAVLYVVTTDPLLRVDRQD